MVIKLLKKLSHNFCEILKLKLEAKKNCLKKFFKIKILLQSVKNKQLL